MLYYNLITRLKGIFCSFLLCSVAQREVGMAQPPPKYALKCTRRNGHSVLVTARNHSTSVFKRRGLLILFFIKSFIYNKIYMYISVGA